MICFSVTGVIHYSAASSLVMVRSSLVDGVEGFGGSWVSGITWGFYFGVSLEVSSLVYYSGIGGFDCCLSSFSKSSSNVIIFFLIGISSMLTTFLFEVYSTGAGVDYTFKSMIGTDYFSMNFFKACFVFKGSGFSS